MLFAQPTRRFLNVKRLLELRGTRVTVSRSEVTCARVPEKPDLHSIFGCCCRFADGGSSRSQENGDRFSRPYRHRRGNRIQIPGVRSGQLDEENKVAGHFVPSWRGRTRR